MPLESTFATDRPTVPKPTMATLSGPSARCARSGRAPSTRCARSGRGPETARAIVSVFCISLTLLPRLDRHRIEERHHAAQLGADLLDRMLLLGRARLVEL